MPDAITVKIEGLEKLREAFKRSPGIVSKQIQRAISLSVALVNREAKIEAPVRTGRLRSGIRSKISPFKGTVESTVVYGVYVHEGTSAHIIKPVKKKALYWKGAAHPVKSVQHPGTRANPFMKRGVSRSEGQIQFIFQRAINNITTQLAK
jgi:hypothetical protein